MPQRWQRSGDRFFRSPRQVIRQRPGRRSSATRCQHPCSDGRDRRSEERAADDARRLYGRARHGPRHRSREPEATPATVVVLSARGVRLDRSRPHLPYRRCGGERGRHDPVRRERGRRHRIRASRRIDLGARSHQLSRALRRRQRWLPRPFSSTPTDAPGTAAATRTAQASSATIVEDMNEGIADQAERDRSKGSGPMPLMPCLRNRRFGLAPHRVRSRARRWSVGGSRPWPRSASSA